MEHKVDDRRNRVSISNSVHRYIHTKLYYSSIFKNFSPLTDSSASNKAQIILRLKKFEIILSELSKVVKLFVGV